MQDKTLYKSINNADQSVLKLTNGGFCIIHHTQESVKKMNEFVNKLMDSVKEEHRLVLK